jgi:hypothetical protein
MGLRNRVFPKYFVVTNRFRKKPGFLDLHMGLRNRVFPKYFVITDRFRKKPGFLGTVEDSETGFFRNTSLSPIDSGKNPVSWAQSKKNRAACGTKGKELRAQSAKGQKSRENEESSRGKLGQGRNRRYRYAKTPVPPPVVRREVATIGTTAKDRIEVNGATTQHPVF